MWTYKIVINIISEEELNILGAEGWELICITGNSMFFKKPASTV